MKSRRISFQKAQLWRRVVAVILAVMQVVYPASVAAQTVILPDGRTRTAVENSGQVWNVSTGTMVGSNAFNSFSAFTVGSGNTANLLIPSSAANLINIVRDQRSDVYGILNAIKDGRIGGNVWFANPHGFVVGAGGVVNMGSLTVVTPTQRFVDDFFLAPDSPDGASVAQLLSGTAPRNPAGLISIQGRINTEGALALEGGMIDISGDLLSGARFAGTAPDFTDVVNVNGLASATNVMVREGRIQIVADADVAVSGTVAAPGGQGVRGGDISIRAGGNVELKPGTNVSARGNGVDSAGGTINVWGGNNASFHAGAILDASAGSSGDGGAIELSAKNLVTLAGGQFRAGAENGRAGSILIDPSMVGISADVFSDGAAYSIIATDFIALNDVFLSTRQVAAGDANRANIESAASIGASGNLLLQAPTITVGGGSKLLAHGSGAFAGGDVTLTAARIDGGDTQIIVSDSAIMGGNVTLSANSSYSSSLLAIADQDATVAIQSSRIVADGGDVAASSSSAVDVSTSSLSPLGVVGIGSTASVEVGGNSQIITTGSGDARFGATSIVTAKALPGGPNFSALPGDAGVAINVVDSHATTRIGGTSTVSVGGLLDVAASNTVNMESKADASASGAAAVGGTLALSVINSATKAAIEDNATVTQSGSINVAADSRNALTSTAKASGGGATQKGAAASKTEETLAKDKYKDAGATPDGSVAVAAAVAISDLTDTTQAYIASSMPVNSSGTATVSSTAHNKAATIADGSSTTSGAVGVGAAVALNIAVGTNAAYIGDNSRVTAQGVTVSAVSPAGEKNDFGAEAKSGAGAKNVGVAGALAANVAVNTTVASIEGDKDNSLAGADVNAGAGDILIEARNATASTVKSGADVKGTGDSAKVGVGASVGMNVAVNTTVAEAGDQAKLTGGDDLALNAKGEHTLSTEVTGGASGAGVAVTPVAAVTIGVNTTTAQLNAGQALDITGAYGSVAEQTATSTTVATGQTQGDQVAVGASIALTVATDTVAAGIERDIDADKGVSVEARSAAKSSADATASVKGGEKAKDDGSAPAPGGGAGSGQSVDEKVAAQGDAAKAAGKKTAAVAPATPAAGTGATAKLDESKPAPKTEDTTQAGGVSVAAAVGVNAGIATTSAKVGKGRTITSVGGALKVTSTNQTDAAAKADGSQVDSGNTDVGVGAAVAINVGISTNAAVVGDNAIVNTNGLTVSAVNASGEKSDYSAEAKSGAGAGNVGVAGSLAANVAVNTTVAALEDDADNSGSGASVNAGTGDILIEAANATTSTVKSGAVVAGTGGSAKVGVGASVGMNVGVNTTVAEVADKAILAGGNNLGLNARGDHTLTTDVTGGATGAQVAVTPLAAVTVAVNTASARLGESATAVGIGGKYSSTAEQTSSATTTATGQTEGSSVAVGASIGLTVAVDTVAADVERDINAATGVEVNAKSAAKSSTSATASVKGGEKADSSGNPPGGPNQSVDQKVAGQQDKATAAGKATAAKAPATTPAAGGSAVSKLDTNKQTPPKGESSEGGVAVAAAVGVNVGIATTTAKVGRGRNITSGGGALKVTSANQTDTSAKADGSQVDGGNTDVGVGAAVALNVGVATTTATVSDEADVATQGLILSATGITGEKSDSHAEAKSGAGAGNVGVAGALAINSATNTTLARIEGDTDNDSTVAQVDAGGGAVLIEAQNATTSTAKSGADVKMSGSDAKVGVGASIGVNVAVNTTVAEVVDNAELTDAAGFGLNAKADHAMSTEVTGGAAGAKVSVTPVVAASIAVNTTTARLGESATTGLDVNGAYSSKAEQTSTVTTKATGQAQGDVAVGASLGASIAVDNVSATVERNLDASNGIDLDARSDTSITTEVKAGAKGAKAAKKDASGNETPEAGTTVDEQKKTQLDFAKGRNTNAAGVSTDTPEAKTPDTTEKTPDTTQPTNPPAAKDKQGKKVSVAAAIGATVAYNEAKAEIKAGKSVSAGTGKLGIHAGTDTNYRTLATGEAVSDGVGVAAAVALTATYNKTQANLGANVAQAGDIDITATSNQNRGTDFQKTMSAEAVSGASGGEVAVAGSLAVVGNYNETRASIDEDASIGSSGTPVGDVTVKAEDTSKVSAQARAGALSTGDKSKAGVGASFAVLLSYNKNTAAAGYDANKDNVYSPTNIFADSLTVTSTKNRVRLIAPTAADAVDFVTKDAKNLDFDALDPSTYLGSNNYYTEAIAGAAAKGNAAVAGAFSINVFGNTTEASLGSNVNVTASGRQAAGDQLGVQVSSRADTQAIAFSGAVAGAKKAGVGISNTDIVNLDETTAAIGAGSSVLSNAADAGIKVSTDSKQDIANVSVSAGAGTESTGVGGVLGVSVSLNKAEALIGDGATVKSKGDLAVTATNATTAVMVSGGIGGGKEAGVGAAIAANIMANKTTAAIGGNAVADARKNLTVAADADETAVSVTVAGAGGGKAGVAGAISLNVVLSDTEASVEQGAQLNTDAAWAPITAASDQSVAITARDDTVIVGVGGGVAGAGKVGVGAALDTAVVVKSVKARIADDVDGLNVANVNAAKSVNVEAISTENVVSGTLGFGGGGSVGVGGAVGVIVNKNDVQAGIGKSARVDSDGNVKVNAEDDITAVLVSGGGAGGGNTGVGGSLAVATLVGSTKAYVGENAAVNARGNRDAATVYTGDTVVTLQPDSPAMPGDLLAKKTEQAKGLSVTAYNRENLVTTVVGGAGGGTAGVAATVSANVIANTAEAHIGRGAKINENNAAAGAEQQVRVKAVDETLLIDTAGAGAGGGSAGVGAAANVAVVAKTTKAWIGQSALVNANQAVELDAASSALTFSTTAGFAGGGSAGVGGAVGAVGVANTTMAYIEDAASAASAAKVNVSGGDLALHATDFATSWLITGAGAGGGAAGVGGSLAVGVNASTTTAKIGDYAETNASGTTEVHADSTENVNSITVAGAGGGSAGVSGTIGVNVVVSKTEAGIGDHAKINQVAPGQNVEVKATDRIITVAASGAGAGGGAAGVGGTANVTVALNTTSAYVGNGAEVDAAQDVKVGASSEKYVNSAAVAGAGGGAAGVAGAVSVISVGSLLDGEAKSGLSPKDENGNTTTTQSQADGQMTKSAVGDMLGSSGQSVETKGVLDSNASKLAVGSYMEDNTPIPLRNTQAFIGHDARVMAGRDVTVSARDTTLAIVAAGAGAGGGAAGVAGSLGVVLLHDSAEAFIADGAQVDAGKTVIVAAETGETAVNLGITGGGAGAAGVTGSVVVNVVSSDTSAYIGDAQINQGASLSDEQSVAVTADSASNLITVAGSGSGAGAAAVGGVLNVNTLFKDTKAYIGEGANVAADSNVEVSAESSQNIVGGGVSIRGAGAAAVGAVASANVIANTTEAFIGSAREDATKTAAVVDSGGNVKLLAADDTLVVAVSAVGNGAGAAGVGANVGANVVSSQTRAYVSDSSEVNARGNAEGIEVYNGMIDNAQTEALPSVPPEGGSGDVDVNRDGVADGNVNGGVSFSVKADGDSGGSGGADSAVNPAAAKDADGNAIAGAAGGLGTKGKDAGVKGLSVVALGNEKMITATIGVAGAGAAAVTGAATANVVSSVTEAAIGDGTKINTVAGGADPSVRVRAADNTFMVQAGGTVSGAGAAAVSGNANAAIVAKQTHARIGDADVKAGNVEVMAAVREDLYNISTNLAVAGAAGVGAAIGVNVISNETLASIGAGADIDASGDIRVRATQDSAMDLYTIAGAGGIVGVSGAISVGVIDNTTKAYVEGAALSANAATLNAGGTTEIKADANEDMLSVTVSAAGGGVGVAGAVGVRVVSSETAAYIGDNTRVNQTRGGAAQDVIVSAEDTVKLSGGGGSVALTGMAGVGATAEVNIVRNTTTAYAGNSALLDADRDVSIRAASVKDVQSAAIAAAGGGSVGIGGAVSVVSIGAKLDAGSQGGLSSQGSSGQTASFVDSRMKEDKVSSQLGSSEHVQGAKTTVASRTAGMGVAADMNDASAGSLDKTRAYIGGGSRITAGRDVKVAATDKIKVDVNAVGAAGGFVGIGGAIGVASANSTTEAFVAPAAIIDATGDVEVEAGAGNVDASGATVRAAAGAGGVVGLSAAVAVMNDTSTTRAYLGSGSEIQRAAALSLAAGTDRKVRADTFGATAGALAIGASVARASFDGSTAAYFDSGVLVGKMIGKTVDDVLVTATDVSTANSLAVAGAAGILAGSGADAEATMDSEVGATLGSDADVVAQGKVSVSATATTQTDARALGINIGAGAVGASLANARSNATVSAALGSGTEIAAAQLDVLASRQVGAAPSALARATGASGGLLLGVNATVATAESTGTISALVGADSTLTVSGVTTVKADSESQQTSSGEGFSSGFIAVGADYSRARSDTLTEATLGDGVKATGGTLQVLAASADANYAYGLAGSGGLASAPFSEASTTNTSRTYARTGSGNNTAGNARKIDVNSLLVSAGHDARFDSWMNSTNASLIGVSGAKATNAVTAQSEAHIGTSGYVEADNITMQAHNDVLKDGPASGQIPGLSNLLGLPLAVPAWNVDSSSGGLADVPAAGSKTTITNNALVQVGAGAHLEQTGNSSSPGVYNLDAWNNVTAIDKVRMSSGGAVSAASGKSEVLADTNNATVRVGDFAGMISVGDMALGARSVADLYTQVAVDVYGLVGVAPAGDSVSRFQAANTIDIGAGATMESLRDIKLAAGASTADAANDIKATARTDVYNNTAIPVNRDPDADAIIGTHSGIAVGSGADVAAVRHVSLFAEEGAATASGVGIGKDIYREILAAIASAISNAFGGGDVSFETRTGRSIKNQTSDVEVNGDVRVGTHRKQELVIGINGVITTQTDGITITGTGFRDVAADIQARINDLEKLIADYKVSNASADASIAVAAYNSEISFLRRKLMDMGITTGEVAKSGISPLQAAQQSVSSMNTTVNGYTTTKDNLAAQNTTLGNDNTTLGNDNTTLTGNNTTLTGNNTTLASQNNTLNTVTIPDLEAQRTALDPASPTYTTDYNNLTSQITAAQDTVANNNTTISSNNDTIAANNTTITSNNTTIASNNTTIANNNEQITTLNSDIDRLNAQIGIVQAGINGGDYSSTPASGPVSQILTIGDVTAQAGNIYVRGDRLHGSGMLDAPGDAEIRITNNSPSFLTLKNLTIPPDEGGKLYFNSVDVRNNTEINNVNGPASGAAFTVNTAENATSPRILVESRYNPLETFYTSQTSAGVPRMAPDIVLQGDVSNLRGLVKIDSAAGSIRLEQKRDEAGNLILPPQAASIRANDVEITTRNGDFVQSYTDSFFHTAGAPLTVIPGDPNLTPITNPGRFNTITQTPESAGAGIVANGSVLIAARYLNINGVIQSGIPEWGVRVPASATVTIGAGSGTFADAQAHYNALSPAQKTASGAEYYEVNGATVAGLPGNLQGNWEKIAVRYNARENRLELGGVQVQGGYIELFGQIFNTNQNGGGQLRVLDGYGQIKVDNQTSLPLWINTLDTGRGVKGEINITNITGIADGSDPVVPAGTPIFTTTTYTRASGASRDGGYYNPASGVRYGVQVGKTSGKQDNYRYSGGAILGIQVFPTQLDQYWISGFTLDNTPIVNNGEFLGVLPGVSGHYATRTQVETTSSAPVTTRSWFECNWWTLCAYGTYYREFNITSASKSVTTGSIRADYPIAIQYIGFDNGAVDLNSTGDIVLGGAVSNRDGNTSVTSAASIAQNGDLPIVRGNNVNLSAGTGIGSDAQSLQVNVNDGGRLDATSTSGEVRVSQVVGDLKVGMVGGAGVSNVVLEAERSLLPWDSASYIQGQRVELLSHNGGIGALSNAVNDPLVVRTGYTVNQAQWPNNGLMATARDNINLKNVADPGNAAVYSGNLLLIAAESLVGDVRIETAGSVIDNNPFATTDTRTQQELADLWDSLRLRGTLAVEKADEAVAAFENGKSNNYQLYWQLRKHQPDQGAVYDPGFQYTASQAESDALAASGMNATQISQFAANRTSQYHQLHAEVGGLNGGTYTSGYHYDATPAEEAQIRKGSSWTDAQLALSVGAGLLKNITDTVTTIKEPNAKGRNITLVAGSDIGSFNDPLAIDLAAGLDTLTMEQKAALAAAERGDATLAGNIITITQPRPVNATTGTGALNATAGTGFAFIGSEQDLRIDRIDAASDIRIKTAGSLINAASLAGADNLVGGNMILEAANGGIGSIPDDAGAVSAPLRISPASGAGIIARAANDIWIESSQDMLADTMFSRSNLYLDAVGSILDFHSGESSITPDNNLRSNNMTLMAQTGTIGTPGNPLDTGVNPDGLITAVTGTPGMGIYLNGPAGESFNIGSVISGDAVSLSSATSMMIDGSVTASGPIGLVSGGLMTMTPNADVHATTLGVFLRAGALTMENANDNVSAARMRVDAGTIDIETAGDARITGIETGNPTASAIRIVSTAGRVLDNGDARPDIIADQGSDAQLTIEGAQGIGDDPLDVRVANLEATSGGVVDLAVDGPVNIVAITAGDRVLLTAGGDITGNSVASAGTGNTNPDKSISITSSNGNVNLASVSGQTDVAVSGRNGVAIGALNAGSDLQLAGPYVSAVVNGGAGTVGGSVTGYGGGIASDVNLTLSGSGGFAFDNFWTSTASVNLLLGAFSIGNALIVDQAAFVNPFTMLLVDQHNRSIQPSDVQLYSAGTPLSLSLSGNHVFTDAFVIYRSPLHDAITPSGQNTSAAEQGEGTLARISLPPPVSGREDDEGAPEGVAVTYTGAPVSLECQSNLDPGCMQ